MGSYLKVVSATASPGVSLTRKARLSRAIIARTSFPSVVRTANCPFGSISSTMPSSSSFVRSCSVRPPLFIEDRPLLKDRAFSILSVTSSGLPTPSTLRRSPAFS